MYARIVHGQTFRASGVVEGLIGGDQHRAGEARVFTLVVYFQGGRQLHRIIGASGFRHLSAAPG